MGQSCWDRLGLRRTSACSLSSCCRPAGRYAQSTESSAAVTFGFKIGFADLDTFNNQIAFGLPRTIESCWHKGRECHEDPSYFSPINVWMSWGHTEISSSPVGRRLPIGGSDSGRDSIDFRKNSLLFINRHKIERYVQSCTRRTVENFIGGML
jgi:hypothetical protein